MRMRPGPASSDRMTRRGFLKGLAAAVLSGIVLSAYGFFI